MPATTHDVAIGATEVTKRFRSWERGEPDREWRGLELLDTYAPGLAPKPLARGRDGDRPVIVMSRLHGQALGSRPLSESQVTAVATALNTLHTAVPSIEVSNLPRRLWSAAEAVEDLRRQVQQRPEDISVEVRRSFEAGTEWIASAEATGFADAAPPPVFAQADGNLANFVWNGSSCGLVDFEDSGASDRAFEIADLVEHVSSWLTGVLNADALLHALGLDEPLAQRVQQARRVMALFWLIMLLPGHPGHPRNPAGSVDRQAQRLLHLLV